jgi:hypothetical protein
MNAVRRRVCNEWKWRNDTYRGPALRWFRSLSNDDIDAFHMTGVKIGAKIREIRDQWDDDRVVAFFGFPQEALPLPPDPAIFWAARPDIFNVVGG